MHIIDNHRRGIFKSRIALIVFLLAEYVQTEFVKYVWINQ